MKDGRRVLDLGPPDRRYSPPVADKKSLAYAIGGAIAFAMVIVAGFTLFKDGPEPAPSPIPHRDIVGTEHKRYSQFNEEIVVRDFFQDEKGGFFLDVDCAWPIKTNTTFFLERHLAWSGIAIDANSSYAADWERLRPRSAFRNYLVTDHSGSLDKFYAADALGSVHKGRVFNDQIIVGTEIEVPSTTLNDLLEREGVERIDFLSMDIEESEPEALAGFDIQRYKPRLICIEASPSIREAILQYFSANGYERIEKYLEHDRINWYFKPLDEGQCATRAQSPWVAHWRPTALFRNGSLLELEPFVSTSGDFVALASVLTDTADVRHEDSRLAGNIGTEIPGVAGRRGQHRSIGDLVHVGDPLLLRLDGGLDGRESF